MAKKKRTKKSETDEFLRDFVRENYKKIGLTQQNLADAAGYQLTHINAWLGGNLNSELSTNAVFQILKRMGVDVPSIILNAAKEAAPDSEDLTRYLESAAEIGFHPDPESMAMLRALDGLGLFWNRSTAEIDAIVQSLLDLVREARSRPAPAPWRIQSDSDQ